MNKANASLSQKCYSGFLAGFSVKFDGRQMNNLKLKLLAKSENKIVRYLNQLGLFNLLTMTPPLSKSASCFGKTLRPRSSNT